MFWALNFENQQVKRGKDQGKANRKYRKDRQVLVVVVDAVALDYHEMIRVHNQMINHYQDCHKMLKNKFYGKKWEQGQGRTHLLKSQSQKENDFIF